MTLSNLLSGLAIGGLTGAAILFADLATATTLNLRDAAGILVFVSGLVWWMGRKFAAIETKLDQHADLIANLPCEYCQTHRTKKGNHNS